MFHQVKMMIAAILKVYYLFTRRKRKGEGRKEQHRELPSGKLLKWIHGPELGIAETRNKELHPVLPRGEQGPKNW